MNTALLILDVQKIYTDPESELYCENCEETIANINKLVDKFTGKSSPVFYIRHVNKADGSELGRMYDYLGDEVEEFDFVEGTAEVEYDENLKLAKVAEHIVKNRYSAFIGTDLSDKLSSKGVERVVICGFMTNFCCESTAREAHDRDYYVDFIMDATGTPGTENMGQAEIRSIVSEFLEEGFACVLTTEEFLS